VEGHGSGRIARRDVYTSYPYNIIYMFYMSMVIPVLIMFSGGRGLEAYGKSQRNGNGVPITHPLPRTLQRNRPPVARTHTYGSKCVYIRTLSSDDRHAVCRRRRRLYLYNPDCDGIFFLDV